MQQQARQTAYKAWIANLLNGDYIKQPGEWEPNYVACNDLKISRVNILATVIGMEFGENIGTLTVDDGSATIQVRAFKEDVGILRETTIGGVITIIGRPREFQNVLYITPEIIRKVDNPAWLTVRKLELQKLFGEPEKVEKKQPSPAIAQQEGGQVTVTPPTPQTTTPPATETGRQLILNLVEKAGEEGIAIETLITQTQLPEQETEASVQELLKDGEIYMSRPGQVKIV